MKRKLNNHPAVIGVAAAALTLTLTACGGGGGGGALNGTDVSVSATQDSAQALNFTAGVAGNTTETGEPLVLGDAQLATSETAEPSPL